MTFSGIQHAKSSLLFPFLMLVSLHFILSMAAPSPFFCFECPSIDLPGCIKDALGPATYSSNISNLQEQLSSERRCVPICARISSRSGVSSAPEATLELNSLLSDTGNSLEAVIFHSKVRSNPRNHSSDERLGTPQVPEPAATKSYKGSGEEETDSGCTPSDLSSREEFTHQTPGRRSPCSDA